MKAIIFDGLELTVKDYTDSYDFISSTVGGYIERVPMDSLGDIDLWVNEEGKYSDLPITAVLKFKEKVIDYIQGNLVFTKHDGEGETISLDADDIKKIKDKFNNDGFLIDFKTGNLIQSLDY